MRLSREYMTGEPFPLFLEMRRVRGRMHDALDRRMWPRDATDLYLLLGCLNDLMAVAAYDLGYPHAAEELIRAGWAYAIAIDHHPLMAAVASATRLRRVLAWQARDSRDLAASGLQYLLCRARRRESSAQVRAGGGQAGRSGRRSPGGRDAHEARERESTATICWRSAASSPSHLPPTTTSRAPRWPRSTAQNAEAAEEVEQAASLYDAGPGPGEQHWFGAKALANIDLATIRLRSGALDAAAAALESLLSLPPAQRITVLTTRLSLVRAELAAPIFRSSPQARDLDEQIEEFGRESITAGLHSISGGP